MRADTLSPTTGPQDGLARMGSGQSSGGRVDGWVVDWVWVGVGCWGGGRRCNKQQAFGNTRIKHNPFNKLPSKIGNFLFYLIFVGQFWYRTFVRGDWLSGCLQLGTQTLTDCTLPAFIYCSHAGNIVSLSIVFIIKVIVSTQ